jgi:hypothetical protein
MILSWYEQKAVVILLTLLHLGIKNIKLGPSLPAFISPTCSTSWWRTSTSPRSVKENISWVGKVDWELRKFHGEEYSTHRGSTYNSYLVRDEKTVLIDTVWKPFAGEFVENLKQEIDLTKMTSLSQVTPKVTTAALCRN